MKVALITDTHYGARNDSGVFADFMREFYTNVFFPHLKDNNITKCIHLGDVFDRRKYINYKSLFECKDYFFDPLAKAGIDTLMIAGNHDTFYKTTNQVNSVKLLLNEYSNIQTFDAPTEVDNCLLLPWICKDNYEQSMNVIKNTKEQVVFGHLEVDGFEAHAGYFHDGGLDKKIFDRFDMVMSGHFHHKSDNGTIYYLGNPYELTWQDYKDQKGFHVFDTETRDLQFIPNPYTMFHKYVYNDVNFTIEDVEQLSFDYVNNKYIKIIVQDKTNPYLFDLLMDKVYKSNPFDISVVENYIDIVADEEIIDEAQDTLTILSNYIDQMNTDVNKKKLDGLVKNLYTEALTVE